MKENLEEKAAELLDYYSQQNIDALITSIRSTLDNIRKRIHATISVSYKEKASSTQDKTVKFHGPLFKSDFVLVIPNISISPALDEIQSCMNTCVHMIIGISKDISQWDTQWKTHVDVAKTNNLKTNRTNSVSSVNDDNISVSELSTIGGNAKSYYPYVSRNKEIIKLVGSLSTIINAQKKEVDLAVSHYEKYSHVWLADKTKIVEEFESANPSLDDIDMKIRYYKDVEGEIKLNEEWVAAGPVALYTG